MTTSNNSQRVPRADRPRRAGGHLRNTPRGKAGQTLIVLSSSFPAGPTSSAGPLQACRRPTGVDPSAVERFLRTGTGRGHRRNAAPRPPRACRRGRRSSRQRGFGYSVIHRSRRTATPQSRGHHLANHRAAEPLPG